MDGRKNQFRRIIKIQPPTDKHVLALCVSSTARHNNGRLRWITPDGSDGTEFFSCPYGKPGDRLWVRETWALEDCGTDGDRIIWAADRAAAWRSTSNDIYYLASDYQPSHWRRSIYMPRWASRISLDVKAVRVERLHDISEVDAQAEGVGLFIPDHATPSAAMDLCMAGRPHAAAFCVLWHKINGPGSWQANPSV